MKNKIMQKIVYGIQNTIAYMITVSIIVIMLLVLTPIILFKWLVNKKSLLETGREYWFY